MPSLSALPASYAAYRLASPPEDDDRQPLWLDALSDAEYAGYARDFFDRSRNAEHLQAFLSDTRKAFERDCAMAGEV